MKPVNNTTSHNTVHFDATGQVLGRLSTQIATCLRGKNKVTFRNYRDVGDVVIVTNASQVKLTGNKEEAKVYAHHSGYPGGLKQATAAKIRATSPEQLIIHAVKGMLPNNKLRDVFLKRLKVYAEDEVKSK